ncbi:MAG: hypothetical protein KDD58_10675 [Bdellovibrionales bacterium]|nr:hypothetical protein [Bdellovibrionales bacterium]
MSESLKKNSRSLIKDAVKARDFNNLNLIYSCEQCSYFQPQNGLCNLGFPNQVHRQDNQLKSYNMSGKFAFCRYLEID